MELVEQALHISITIEIDVGRRMAVSRQKFLNAERVSGVAGPHNRNVAYALRQQFCPAKNEGTHQDLAQLSIGLH